MKLLAVTIGSRPRGLRGRAFTMVEAVISLVIVAVMLVAALTTVGAAKLGQYKTSQRSRGQLLAEALMAEILQQNYKEPTDTPVFGCESGESATSRANYDDVDDYNGWSSSPPLYKDGTQMSEFTGWRRSVTVEWVNPTNPAEVKLQETNAKRITVTVLYQNMQVARLVAIRTASGY